MKVLFILAEVNAILRQHNLEKYWLVLKDIFNSKIQPPCGPW